MGATIEISLDEDRRIVRQRIDGDLNADVYQQVDEQTQKLAAELRDPANVLILVDGRKLGKADHVARQALMHTLDRPTLNRLAVFGPNLVGRVMARFIIMVSGVKKMRLFENERDAVEWLLS